MSHIEENDLLEQKRVLAAWALVGFQLSQGPCLHRTDAAQTDTASQIPGQDPGSFYHLFMELKDPPRGPLSSFRGCRTLNSRFLCVHLSLGGWKEGFALCLNHFHISITKNSTQSSHILPRCLLNTSATYPIQDR